MTETKPTPRSLRMVDPELLPLIEDAPELTRKELEQECIAAADELRQRRSWMSDSAVQLTARIPTSIFALALLVSS